MKNSDFDIELIERFLEGTLNEQEKEAFLARVEAEPEFAAAFNQRKLLQASYTEASKRVELKKQIGLLIEDEKHKTLKQRKLWLAAAAVVVLASLGSLLIFNPGKPDMENDYAKNLQIHEAETTSQQAEGQLNRAIEYAAVDSVVKVKQSNGFYPNENTLLSLTDTIRFSWPESIKVSQLIISDSKNTLVRTINIQTSAKQHLLMPGSLNPGLYSWKIQNDPTINRFRINR